MIYMLRKSTYFRKYENIGYIENPTSSISKVVDGIGAMCLSQLSYEPRNIDEIVKNLLNIFDNIEEETLRKDLIDFYKKLVKDGFLSDKETIDDGGYTTVLENCKVQNKQNGDITTGEFMYNFLTKHPRVVGLHIELLSKCNERCIHCYIPHEKKDAQINKELMLKVLEECKRIGTLSLTFSGGEPMLHPNFCEFLKKAKDLDFSTTVLSNLTLLNDNIIQMLMYRHPTCVCVSVYSMRHEIHDAITSLSGSHEITIKNILRLIDNNIPVRINCVVMKQNKDSFYEVVEWGKKNGCAVAVDFSLSARNDGSADNLCNRLTEEEIKQVIEKYICADINYRKSLCSILKKQEIDDSEERVCGVGTSMLSINSNGDVYPCVGWDKFNCGNLKKNTLQEIWDNSSKIKFLRNLRMKDFTQCKGCVDKRYCHICISSNFNESSNEDIFNISQTTCDTARIQHELAKKYCDKDM